MREHKYRAWHRERKVMTKPMTLSFIAHESGLKLQSPTDEYEWLEYTTVNCKDGREIYEGDIVRQQFLGGDGQNEVPLDDMIFQGVVLWDFSGWGIDSMGDGEAEVDIVNNSILEVLGNKFENGELLKEVSCQNE